MSAVGKKIYGVTLKLADGRNHVEYVATNGSTRDAMGLAEQAQKGSEATGSTSPMCQITVEGD